MRCSFGSAVVPSVLLTLALAGSAGATFHIMSISEIGAGFGGDATIQFVELRLDSSSQSLVLNTRLTTFDASGNATELLLTPGNVGSGARGANILYATSAFATATGVTPDFVIAAGLVTPTGMICWGAPGASAPNPSTWDLTNPNNYVDCVAYGAYDATTRNASGTPSSLGAGDGTQSLTRAQGSSASGSNSTDFALATPNVCNNAGDCTDLAIGEETCGDADGNGTVTLTDGVQTLRAAAGLPSSCTPARCDLDGNGTVSLTDGVQVLRAAAGLPITGTCAPG